MIRLRGEMRVGSFTLPLLCLALVLSGCTVIHIEGGERAFVPRFGVLRIEAPDGARTIVYRSTGLGLVPGRDGVTLGARTETVALVYAPDDCRIVLFQPSREDLVALREALVESGLQPACILGESK
jgi:hypothetical protein